MRRQVYNLSYISQKCTFVAVLQKVVLTGWKRRSFLFLFISFSFFERASEHASRGVEGQKERES